MCTANRERRGAVRGFLGEVARTDKRGGSMQGVRGWSGGGSREKAAGGQTQVRQGHSFTENEGNLLWRSESTQPYGIVGGSAAESIVTTAVP